jgi:catechol 2,3-dioxygenase-like lactoylglutathione lyase family enzyme
MQLGAFSVSLAVKDLAASRAFYEKLGFSAFAGVAAQGWLILRNGDHVLGLFQGMFERNLLTFNPGWDQPQPPSCSRTRPSGRCGEGRDPGAGGGRDDARPGELCSSIRTGTRSSWTNT